MHAKETRQLFLHRTKRYPRRYQQSLASPRLRSVKTCLRMLRRGNKCEMAPSKPPFLWVSWKADFPQTSPAHSNSKPCGMNRQHRLPALRLFSSTKRSMSEQSKEDLRCVAEGLAYGPRRAKKKKREKKSGEVFDFTWDYCAFVRACLWVCVCVCLCLCERVWQGYWSSFGMQKYQPLCTLPYLTLFGAFEGFALVSSVDLPKKVKAWLMRRVWSGLDKWETLGFSVFDKIMANTRKIFYFFSTMRCNKHSALGQLGDKFGLQPYNNSQMKINVYL